MEQVDRWALWGWIGGSGGRMRGSVSSAGFSRSDLVTSVTA